jgi:molybdopterin molybdotransferase
MLSVKDAETIIFNHVRPLNQEHDLEVVDLLTAFHRILATPVISSLDLYVMKMYKIQILKIRQF